MDKKEARNRLSTGKKLLFSAIFSLVLIGSLEASFRLFGLGEPQQTEDYISDWELQWSSQFYVIEPEYRGDSFNAEGVRDRDHALEKPPNTIRIACLGDSVTYGYGLPATESYPSLLEPMLLANNQQIEVLNIALPGWATRQHRIAYQKIARKYSPDHVILGVCLNDIPEMKNNLSKPSATLTFLYRYSNVARWLLRPQAREIHRVEELFEFSDQAKIKEGWTLFFRELDLLLKEVEADGAELTILVFPFRIQVLPQAPNPIPQTLIKEYCQRKKIRCFDGLETLESLGASAFLDYDHLSVTGTTAIARMLSESEWHSDRDK